MRGHVALSVFAVAMGYVVTAFGSSGLWNVPFSVKIDVQKESSRKKLAKEEHGKGREKAISVRISAQVTNLSLARDLDGLCIRLYVTAEANAHEHRDRRCEVVNVLEQADVVVPKGATQTIELGSESFTYWKSHTANDQWRGGVKYKGYVLEVYRNGELVDVDVSGGTDSRAAYERYLKDPKKAAALGNSAYRKGQWVTGGTRWNAGVGNSGGMSSGSRR
ncbi:MAG: hypothetical protein JXR37_26805 [Kiritimatiellae bacterium]|nr:hypothetical protein [Kiritimatiellia bacterium]